MEFIVTFIVFVIFFIAMSLSLLIKQKPLKGSCGGVATLMGNEECDICGGDPNRCESQENTTVSNGLAYNALKHDNPSP